MGDTIINITNSSDDKTKSAGKSKSKFKKTKFKKKKSAIERNFDYSAAGKSMVGDDSAHSIISFPALP